MQSISTQIPMRSRMVRRRYRSRAPGPISIRRVPLRVGIDLVRVSTVRDAIAAHGDHYLERVYTARELEDCRTAGVVDPLRLAARFAAKEAAMKALRVGDEAVPWPTIEVVRGRTGYAELELHGPAGELAHAQGIASLAVSLTHEDEYASAVVAAELHPATVQAEGGEHR
jgi:holo-[acyl-carrier protein] synthase